jgi:hypothetical protein
MTQQVWAQQALQRSRDFLDGRSVPISPASDCLVLVRLGSYSVGIFEPHMRKADSRFLGFSGWACILQRRFIIWRVALRECAADFRIDGHEGLSMILVRHCSPRSAERTTRPSDREVEHQMPSTDLVALVTKAKFDDDAWSDDASCCSLESIHEPRVRASPRHSDV